MAYPVPVQIDIFSDVICPWCFIGKKRLEMAALLHGNVRLDIQWRVFLLNPGMKPGGMDRKAYIDAKFGAAAISFYDRIASMGAEVGISFAFDKITRTPDSRPAHELILAANDKGIADDLIEDLFIAYFIKGLDISKAGVLADIAHKYGLAFPLSDSGDDSGDDFGAAGIKRRIESDLMEAERIGISGVPYFIFDGEWAVSGAHSPESFIPLFDAVINHRLHQPG